MNTEQFIQWCESYQSDKWSKPLIMGVLNITPDSFSDGGHFLNIEKAIAQAHRMIKAGADIIDIGGESSKPGAVSVSFDEELARVRPIIKRLRTESDICISIDTTKARLMHEAINAGASMINDIAGFQSEESRAMAAKLDVPLCLMHMQGNPQTMQANPCYKLNIVDEINCFFEARIEALLAAGVRRNKIILDPGFGFGKTVEHNLELVNKTEQFKQHRLPLMLGVSRKSTLGEILNRPVDKRLVGGLTIAIVAALQGLAMIRTHDVEETNQALTMVEAIKAGTIKTMRAE